MFKSLIKDKKAIIFDLDGTLVDTEQYWIKAFGTVLESLTDFMTAEEVFGEPGESIYNKWASILEIGLIETPLKIKDLTERTEEAFIRLINENDIQPKAGFWLFMNEIKNDKKLKTALTTNTDKKIAEIVLRKTELDGIFDVTVFGDDVKVKKPNPEIYNTTLKKLGLKSKEATVFEDSFIGIQAALKANLDVNVIWDTRVDKSKYPAEVKEFFIDFVGLAGSLDHTVGEAFEEYRQSILKKPQRTQKQPRLE